MKKILIAFMLLFSTATMAQRLSVAGVEMGASIENAERILKSRYGEYSTYVEGRTEIRLYDVKIGGTSFSHVKFGFQVGYQQTYLSNVNLSHYFYSREDAKPFFDLWVGRLKDKYGEYTYEIDTHEGEPSETCWFSKDDAEIYIERTYSRSKSGEYFWYVTINYHEDFVDESNDY